LTRFNPRLPGGRRRVSRRRPKSVSRVSIHAFRGEGDDGDLQRLHRRVVSIHAFRGEGDPGLRGGYVVSPVSIHAFRGEGDRPFRNPFARAWVVSIHAFRGEGDLNLQPRRARPVGFNPRLPGGRRPALPFIDRCGATFQSTPSGGKATSRDRDTASHQACFNPRLPGGRRR